MSRLLILKSDRICVSMPAVVRALLPNRPTVRQKKKGKFWVGGGGGAKHLTYNLLSSTDDFWGFTSPLSHATVCQMSSNSRHTVGWLYSDWEHLHVGRKALMFVRSSGKTEAWHDASAPTLAKENVRRWRCRPSCWVEQLIQRRPLLASMSHSWTCWENPMVISSVFLRISKDMFLMLRQSQSLDY